MKKEFMRKFVPAALLVAVALPTGAWVVARSHRPEVPAAKAPVSEVDMMYHNSFDEPSMARFRKPLPKAVAEKLMAKSALAKEHEKNARQLAQSRQYAAAEAACRRAMATAPQVNGTPANVRLCQLLGEIYMAQGRYREALPYFSQASRFTQNLGMDLDVALAYCRLGDLTKAKQIYLKSEKALIGYVREGKKDSYYRNLPGTVDRRALEASILFMRGEEKGLSARDAEALEDYQEALRLFPRNGMIALNCAQLLRRLKRYPEALQAFATAATFGTGDIAKRATNSLAAWPAAQRQKALAEAAKLKAAKS